jgi:hypothetical protein
MIPPELRAVLPEGSTVEVLAVDLTLMQARDYLPAQAARWTSSELAIRHAFHFTADQYWQLTVAEHGEMLRFLNLEGSDGSR